MAPGPMPAGRLDEIGSALAIVEGPTVAHELYAEVMRARQAEAALRETLADGAPPAPYDRHVSMSAFALKVSQKIEAQSRLREACREVDRLRAEKAQERKPIEDALRQELAAELDEQAYWAAARDVNGPDCVEATTWTRAAALVRGGEG
jgi:hypothetical protein